MNYKKGLACLGLVCAMQIAPQTVLADDAVLLQVNPLDIAPQVDQNDSAAQADTVNAAVPALRKQISIVRAEYSKLPKSGKESIAHGI